MDFHKLFIFFKKNEFDEFIISENSFSLFEYIISMNDIDIFCLILWLFHNIKRSENNEKNDLNFIILTSNLFKGKILKILDQKELVNHINDEIGVYKDIIVQGFLLFLNLMKCEKHNIDYDQK